MEFVHPPDTEFEPAVEFSCRRCSKFVKLCRSCWRNHGFYSDQCAHEARLKRKRNSQSKHSKTEGERENQAKSQATCRSKNKRGFPEY